MRVIFVYLRKFNESKIGKIFQYSLIKYIALGFGLFKGLINAKFLGPEMLGLLGNLILILGYCSYANLGILNSMNREYVLCKGSENRNKILNTAFTALVILGGVFLVLAIGSVLFYRNIYGIYLALIFLIAIFEQFKTYFINYFRLKDEYKIINLIEVIYSIIAFIITIVLINDLKIYAVLISMLICGIIILIIGVKKVEKLKLAIDKKVLKVLLTIGVPLLIYNLGFYILTTIDRVIIIKYYSESDLGYYTFANSMVSATLVFVTSMLFLLYPKVIKAFNEEEGDNIIEKVKIYTRILEIASVIFFTVGIIVFKPFIIMFLDKYQDSIGIYMLLLMSIITNNLAYFSNCYIVSNKKQKLLVYLQIMSILVNITLNLIFINFGLGVEGVALGTLIANSIYSLVQYVIFVKLTTGRIEIMYTIKVYIRIILYSIFVIIMTVFNLDYSTYVIIGILLTVILYVKETRMIKEYLTIIK